MLVLTRQIGEEVIIGGSIRIAVLALDNGRVRLGIEAPPAVPVDRREVFERRIAAVHQPDT